MTKTDIETKNGVIHVIDTVLLPPADKKEDKAEPAQCRVSARNAHARYVVFVALLPPAAPSHARVSRKG